MKGIYPKGLKIQDFKPNSDKLYSNAEFLVYQEFERLSEYNDIFCIYSFRLEYHSHKNQGEIDFIVISPVLGIIVLEVKGSKLKKDANGFYHCYNRASKQWEQIQNPFVQAEENSFSLINLLTETNKILRKKPLVTWGCIFPENDNIATGSDIPSWRYLNHIDFLHNLYHCLLQISNKEKEKRKHHFDELTEMDIKTIIKTLVGDSFEGNLNDLDLSIGTKRLEEFTATQYKILIDLSDNDRIFFSGAAGTGKTFLAIQEYKRLKGLGKKSKIIVPTDHLKKWIVSILGQVNSEDPVCCWDEIPPIVNAEDKLDCVLVDEAQDFIAENKLNKIDTIVKGGLKSGCWRFFGDPTRQALKTGPIDIKEALINIGLEISTITFYKLTLNVRNTKRINQGLKRAVDLSDTLLIDNDYTGEKIMFIIYEKNNLPEKVNSQIDKILNENHNPHRISIIFRESDFTEISGLLKFPHYSMKGNAFAELSGITIGDEEVFKGLENDIVLYLLPPEEDKNTKQKIYTAMSRARLKLILFCRIDMAPKYIHIIK